MKLSTEAVFVLIHRNLLNEV